MANTLARRLTLTPPTGSPLPKPVIGPAGMIAAQNPDAGDPVTQEPAVAPGMLPQTAMTPLYDPTKAPPIATPIAPPYAEGWKGALQRALIGFKEGASAVHVDPTYNPIAAGLVGGAEAAGAGVQDSLNRKLLAQQAAVAPFVAAQAGAIKKSYEDAAAVPGKQREQQDILNREIEAKRQTLALETDPKFIEPMAQNLAPLSPTQRAVELGRFSGPQRIMLVNRIFEINKARGVSDRDLELQYAADMAGGKAGAVYNTAGQGQQTARAANSVKLLLPGLREASKAFTRTDYPIANTAYASFLTNAGGDRQLALQQYTADAKLKMASALMKGGVPTNEATQIIEHAFPPGMNDVQTNAAADNIEKIMNTQIEGGLTPVSLSAALRASPAAPGAPRKIGRFQVEVH